MYNPKNLDSGAVLLQQVLQNNKKADAEKLIE